MHHWISWMDASVCGDCRYPNISSRPNRPINICIIRALLVSH